MDGRPHKEGTGARRLAGLDFGAGELRTRFNEQGVTYDGDRYSVPDVPKLQAALASGLGIHQRLAATVIAELEAAWAEQSVLHAALRPFAVVHRPDESDRSLRSGKDTLAKILLAIEPLQLQVANILIQKVPEYAAAEDEPANDDHANSRRKRKYVDVSIDDNIPRLALRQMKWMEFIVDPNALCENLIAVLSICPIPLQEEIVAMFPEIADDANQEALVASLLDVKRDSKELAPVILDTLSSLLVPQTILHSVIEDVIQSLSAADCETLPAVTRFLLRTVPSQDIDEALHALRRNVADHSITPNVGKLVLESLRSSFRLRPEVANAALSILRNSSGPNLPADIWFLVALMESPARRKTAEMVFKKRASSGQISARVIDESLAGFESCFQGLTQRLHALASAAMKAPESLSVQLGAHMYSLLHRLFEDPVSRKDVLSSLLEHTGTRKTLEATFALGSLVSIAEEGLQSGTLLGHSTFLFGLLDFVESFTDDQLRLVFKLFANLQLSSLVSTEGRNRRANVNLDIIIRKELTHVDQCYRRIGAIGSCALIGVIGESDNPECIRAAKKFCDLMFVSIRRDPKTESLAYDELQRVIVESNMGDMVLEHIGDYSAEKFEAEFVEELSPAKERKNRPVEDVGFAESCIGSLDSEGELKLPLMALATKNRQKLTVLCSLFGLVAASTRKKNNGSLEEIDALLVCPVTCPPSQAFRDFDELRSGQQETTALCSLGTVNWLRELLNSFSDSQDVELRQKCFARLELLLEEEEKLSSLMEIYNGNVLGSIFQTESQPASRKEKDFSWRDYLRPLKPAALSLLRHRETDASKVGFRCATFLLQEMGGLLTKTSHSIAVNIGDKRHVPMEDLKEPLWGVGPQLASSLQTLAASQESASQDLEIGDMTEAQCFAEKCIALGLDIICSLLSDKGYVSEDYRNDFIATLQLRLGEAPDTDGSSAMRAFAEVETVFLQNELLTFASCGSVLKCLERLSEKANTDEKNYLSGQLSNFSKQLLDRPIDCSKKEKKAHLSVLAQVIRTFIRYTDQHFKALGFLVQHLVYFDRSGTEDEENRPAEEQKFVPLDSLHRSSVSTYIKVLMEELVEVYERTAAAKDVTDRVMLNRTGKFVKNFDELVRVSRGKRETYALCVRSGRRFVDSFLKCGMPPIHRSFAEEPDLCVKTLKSFQASTRFLQSLCNESKAVGDSIAMGMVPSLKKSLETVLYKVKALLEANGGLNSFFLGNLKHRDLAGQLVSSQLIEEDEEEDAGEGDSVANSDTDSACNGNAESKDGEETD